ncbi:MAG: amidohydrolase family protein [Armatimonadota bacterium]
MIVDTNTWVGHWPFQRLVRSTPPELAEHLAAEGIDRAWTAAADAVLYQDPQLGNADWLPAMATHDTLVPVAIIDPSLRNWRDSLKQCVEQWGARVVKLVPSYHRLDLESADVDECIEEAADGGLAVSIQYRMEDERRHHLLMKVPAPPTDAIVALAQRHPETKLHVACAYRPEALRMLEAENLIFEISSLEHMDTLASMTEKIPAERLCFGSHTPFYLARSAVLKVQASALPEETLDQITTDPLL